MPKLLFAPFAGTLLLAAGCLEPTRAVELAARSDVSQPIVYGDPVGAMDDGATPARHKATVALHELARGGKAVYVSPFCSGTLIRDDVVLTAAHCVDRSMSAQKVAVYLGNDPRAQDSSGTYDVVKHLYDVEELLIHPDFDRLALRSDLALLRLAQVPWEAAPVPELRAANGFAEDDVGGALDFAGFGQDENGAAGRKLHGLGTLGGFGCSVAGCGSSGDAATQLSYAQGTLGGEQEGETGPCFGDSGGPSFVERGDGWYVGGVTSYGDRSCDVYGVSTRTDAFSAFIDAFVGDGGAEDPGDEDAGETCGDGVCGEGESCDGRYGTVSCPSDCDGVTTRRPSGRYCYVEGVCEGPGCP